jgi:hypothetical protein
VERLLEIEIPNIDPEIPSEVANYDENEVSLINQLTRSVNSHLFSV